MPMSMELGNQDNIRFCQAFRDGPAPGPVATDFVGYHFARAIAAADCWIATLVTVFNVRPAVSSCWKALVHRWSSVLQAQTRSAKIVSLMSASLQSRLNDSLQRAMAGVFANNIFLFIDEVNEISFDKDSRHPAAIFLNREILIETMRLALVAPISPPVTLPPASPVIHLPHAISILPPPVTKALPVKTSTPAPAAPAGGARPPPLDFCPWFNTNFGCNHLARKSGIPCAASFHQKLSPSQKTELSSFVARMQQKPAYASMVAR